MFLQTRLLSHRGGQPVVLLAALAFALGLGVGATIAPVTVSRSAAAPPTTTMSPQASETMPARPALPTATHPAEVLRVLDGDTFEARINLWPGLEVEMKPRCGEERVKAEAARDALRNLLDQGEVGISHVSLDKYGGRVLADASTRATPNISEALLDAGAVRPYSGGRRDGWCP